jgi:tRNA-2-methylthio-N6-dimethylallyladenosine synthase
MNEYESLIIEKMLLGGGFELISDPDEAQIVLLNTCTIRDNADEKIWNRLNQLIPQKRKNKKKRVGILGCMVTAQKETFMKKYPEIDLLVTPFELDKVSAMLENVIGVSFDSYDSLEYLNEGNSTPFKSYLPIQRGCNFKCSYCIVPYVKGEQESFSHQDILAKLKSLSEQGLKEVTLLGQTINSYKYEDVDFAGLLEMVAKEVPHMWVRFLTSHPAIFRDNILGLFEKYPNLTPFFHLPVQSGSTSILKAMKRGYSREKYLDLVSRIRAQVKDASFSTDMICGFPGETDEDFEESLTLMKEVGFETAFMFFYSERGGTPAVDLPDSVGMETRKQRLAKMIDFQMAIQKELYQKHIGRVEQVLVESESRRGQGQMKGRTKGNLPVVFDGLKELLGTFVTVEIESATAHTLKGVLR